MKRLLWMLSISVLLAVATGATGARKIVVSLSADDVTAHVPQDTTAGTSYVLQIAIPQGVSAPAIQAAYLEFYVDASSVAIDGWQNETPVVEIYMLENEVAGEPNPEQFRKPSGMVRNVPVGDNRRVRINVTEALRYLAENPSRNHGFVLGSFRGVAEGRFTIRNDRLDGGALARLTIVTAD